MTVRVAVSLRGNSRITSAGVLSSLMARMRRSSVAVDTAGTPEAGHTGGNKKAAR
jgi:hypothetical protein